MLVTVMVLTMLILPACAQTAPTPTPAPAPTPTPTPSPTPAPSPTPTPAPAPRETIDMAVLSGTWGENLAFPLAAAELLNRYHPWVRASIVQSSGSEANTQMAAGMKPNGVLYHSTSQDLIASIEGKYGWTKTYPNQGLLMANCGGAMAMLTWDKNIKELKDLAGKKLAILPEPSLSNRYGEIILDYVGIRDQVKIVSLDFGPIDEALGDKTVDAILMYPMGVPEHLNLMPPTQEAVFSLRNEAYIVKIPDEAVKKAVNEINAGFTLTMMDAAAFLPNDTSVTLNPYSMYSLLTARMDMDEEVAYTVTKTLMEHLGEFRDFHPTGQYLTPELVTRNMGFAKPEYIHPGAMRYYKEANLWHFYEEERAKLTGK